MTFDFYDFRGIGHIRSAEIDDDGPAATRLLQTQIIGDVGYLIRRNVAAVLETRRRGKITIRFLNGKVINLENDRLAQMAGRVFAEDKTPDRVAN